MTTIRQMAGVAFVLAFCNASAQFFEPFDGTGTPKGWRLATGDGSAAVDMKQNGGIASFYVDATHDKLGIWWALAQTPVEGIDMKKLVLPQYELRVETRIKVSHAPRRVNLHFNHQRTTDFHSHLMEFDIPDTVTWHTISMTTHDFETQPGDKINCHLALMDWGLGKYRVDFDYFKVDVVDRSMINQDLGDKLPYHPPLADPSEFKLHLDAVADATIDNHFTDLSFNNWHTRGASGKYTDLVTVSGTQFVIMRWDLSSLQGKTAARSGLLELSPYSVQRAPDFFKDFGMVRITEILGGEAQWDEKTVTYDSFRKGNPIEEVINTQMIIDDSLTWNKNGKVLFTISRPVLQRMIDGKTKGLAIKPLGAVNASFYSLENRDPLLKPRLYLDVR